MTNEQMRKVLNDAPQHATHFIFGEYYDFNDNGVHIWIDDLAAWKKITLKVINPMAMGCLGAMRNLLLK